MSTRLIQILTFANVAAGATVPQAHDINVNGRPLIPDFVAFDTPGFVVAATTATTISITNNNSAPTTVRVWLEFKQTTQRWFGAQQTTSLIPQPFTASGGEASAGGTSGVFVWDTGTSWADIYAAMSAQAGPKICLVEWEYGTFRTMGPAAAYNINEIFFVALGIPGIEAEAGITITDGVTFDNEDFGTGQRFAFLKSKDIYWNALCTTTPIYTNFGGAYAPIIVDLDGGGLFSANTVVDGNASLYLKNRAIVVGNGGAGTGVFRVRNANDTVFMISQSELRNRVFFDPGGSGFALPIVLDGTCSYQDASAGIPSIDATLTPTATMKLFANRAFERFSITVDAMGNLVATPL